MQLSKIIWNIHFNRIYRENISGENYSLKNLVEDIWLIITPYFTEDGRKKYRILLDRMIEKEIGHGFSD